MIEILFGNVRRVGTGLGPKFELLKKRIPLPELVRLGLIKSIRRNGL